MITLKEDLKENYQIVSLKGGGGVVDPPPSTWISSIRYRNFADGIQHSMAMGLYFSEGIELLQVPCHHLDVMMIVSLE